MIKRTLEISSAPAHLSVRYQQLVLKRDDQTVGSFPCEDIGLVMVDHSQVTYTHSALTQLAESGAAIVLCGRDHLPKAMVLPLADHSQVVWRLRNQLEVSKPLQKQLWSQLITQKVKAQAKNLTAGSSAQKKLLQLSKQVRSGDPTNIEAQAARIYWMNWLNDVEFPEIEEDGEPFRRDPSAFGVNSLLNYGYAILRASLARAIVSAGLHPSLGIHHHNRSNQFCLADDLIEPFRPLVDERVRELIRIGREELNQSTKAELLNLLMIPMTLNHQTGPLSVMLSRFVSSLVRCYSGETKKLDFPVLLEANAIERTTVN